MSLPPFVLPEVAGTGSAAETLLSLANGRPPASHGLPDYGSLSPEALASLNTISRFSHDAYGEGGPLRLSFNAAMRSWQDMEKKSIFLLPAAALPDGTDLTWGFLDNSMVQMWQLRGRPTSTMTHAMLVGLVGPGLQQPGALAIGSRVSFGTPTYFLSAVEDLEDLAMQHAAAWAVAERRRLEAVRDDGIESEHVAKRIRLGVQEDGGVHSQGEKKDTKVLLDLEGRPHTTRVKTDLADREKMLGVVFRVCDERRWQHIMGTECVLQVEEYARVINEQSTLRISERDAGFKHCGLLDRVYGLGFSVDIPLLKKLLTGDFGGPLGDALDLQKFAGRTVKIPTELTPCTQQNRALVAAIKNMELVFMIFYGAAFYKATDHFVDQLEGLNRPLELAPSGFLLHSLEVALSRFFRTLRMATTTSNKSLRDVSSPAACSAYLSVVLKDFVSSLDTQEKLNEAMARYQLLDYRGRLGNLCKVAAVASKVEVKSIVVPPSASSAVTKAMCGEHFAGQLKAIDPRTSRTFTCTYGDGCRFAHDDVTKWTEEKKSATAGTLSYRFRQPSLDALGKIKSGKTRV
jgi:hypothetical protein